MSQVRVLVVDDEPGILSMFRNVLPHCGAVAVEVAEAPGALRLLGEREFDLVISDMQMPEIDGLKVLECARQRSPKATRVLMSGDPSALARGRGGDSPAQVLLNKPVEISRLRALVAAVAPPPSRLDGLLESMRRRYADSADSVFVKDAQGRYLFMSAMGAALLGRSVPEVVGRLDSEIFDRGTLLEEVRASDQIVLRTRRHYLYVNATRATGAARCFLSVKFPVSGADGDVVAIGCLSRDVTEMVALAAADRARQVDELLRDLHEAASILAAGTKPSAIERSEVESCLSLPAVVTVQDPAVTKEGPAPR